VYRLRIFAFGLDHGVDNGYCMASQYTLDIQYRGLSYSNLRVAQVDDPRLSA
jgi:hypothetical protein